MKTRVYDVPTRVFHWLFATGFITAFTIANTIDDDDTAFSYHMLAGIFISALVLWRILWGLIGTRHARFSDFSLQPNALLSYIKNITSDGAKVWTGHNPASSWAAIAMFLLTLSLATTGFCMISGIGGEEIEDIHELLANAFIVIVLLHIAGIVIHTKKHKDSLGKSMLHGMKEKLDEPVTPVASRKKSGAILLSLSLFMLFYLVSNFDATTRTLDILGQSFHMTEYETSEHYEYEHED
ncbi:cytochrome b/b6 domain-containing protein [Alteromonas facilis]|uniref:cytochrome b/b6 domain-containing protein n=1 Tax=Alteromonas facilis TaxID=2048004 RepID=UPI0013DA815D|nr:cytochrome b/b6 domain-containing protein [Alteromonas facilis]